MKKRSFRSTFVSVILVITVAISIVNLAVYGINIKKIRQVEVLKMKTAGERIDDMITISLNNIKGLKQICCTDNYARRLLNTAPDGSDTAVPVRSLTWAGRHSGQPVLLPTQRIPQPAAGSSPAVFEDVLHTGAL